MEQEHEIKILNYDGVKEFLQDVKYPVYFLDFEAITNSKQWMYDNGLAIDQQLSSFSLLRIDNLDDDETSIKHFSIIGEKEDYPTMAKSMTDFYKDNGTVIVWGRDLEVRGLGKLIKEAPEGQHKKLGSMIANMVDLQQLFYGGSFIVNEPSHKSSLDIIARSYGVYESTSIRDGKKAHFILEHAAKGGIEKSHLDNIKRRIEVYNNSDVINIKRIFVEIMKDIL